MEFAIVSKSITNGIKAINIHYLENKPKITKTKKLKQISTKRMPIDLEEITFKVPLFLLKYKYM